MNKVVNIMNGKMTFLGKEVKVNMEIWWYVVIFCL